MPGLSSVSDFVTDVFAIRTYFEMFLFVVIPAIISFYIVYLLFRWLYFTFFDV